MMLVFKADLAGALNTLVLAQAAGARAMHQTWHAALPPVVPVLHQIKQHQHQHQHQHPAHAVVGVLPASVPHDAGILEFRYHLGAQI